MQRIRRQKKSRQTCLSTQQPTEPEHSTTGTSSSSRALTSEYGFSVEPGREWNDIVKSHLFVTKNHDPECDCNLCAHNKQVSEFFDCYYGNRIQFQTRTADGGTSDFREDQHIGKNKSIKPVDYQANTTREKNDRLLTLPPIRELFSRELKSRDEILFGYQPADDIAND